MGTVGEVGRQGMFSVYFQILGISIILMIKPKVKGLNDVVHLLLALR